MISIEVAMMKIHFGSRSRMRSTSFIDGETAKTGQYRYVGCDPEVKQGSSDFHIEINQDHYVETLMHLEIDGQRFAQPDLALSKRKLANVEQPLLLCSG